jgi:hypothetical protein
MNESGPSNVNNPFQLDLYKAMIITIINKSADSERQVLKAIVAGTDPQA